MDPFPAAVEITPPQRNDLHVWRVRLDRDADFVSGASSLLDRAELDRARRSLAAGDRDRHIVAHATLRLILARYLGGDPLSLTFRRTAHGKPEVDDPKGGLHFNLSRSSGLAVIAVATAREVGVDIECEVADLEEMRLATAFFSPREMADLTSLPPLARRAAFFRGWTRKEAYVKARGGGLSMPLDDCIVSFGPDEPAAIRWSRDGGHGEWSLRDLSVPPSFAGAVAARGPIARVWYYELTAGQTASRLTA
jgi:4'-phosphopantetheinyl transferase